VRGVDGHGGAITGYSDTHKVSYKALRGSASWKSYLGIRGAQRVRASSGGRV